MNHKLVPAILFSGLMSAFATGAYADPNAQSEHAFCGHHEAQSHRPDLQKFVQHRLDRLAYRLEIKASQQPAWESYAQAVANIATPQDAGKATKPVLNEDASAIVHRRANRAAELARKLAAIAEATDALQAVLDENQRKVLAQEVRHHEAGFHGRQFGQRWHGHGTEQRPRLQPELKPNARPGK